MKRRRQKRWTFKKTKTLKARMKNSYKQLRIKEKQLDAIINTEPGSKSLKTTGILAN